MQKIVWTIASKYIISIYKILGLIFFSNKNPHDIYPIVQRSYIFIS